MSTLKYGDSAARKVSARIADPVASMAALKAVDARSDGQKVLVIADGSAWRFSLASALTGDDVLVSTPTNGSGRWLREPGFAMLALPFTFATADAAILLTLQAGTILAPLEFAWNITTSMTGGATPAIGVSSSVKSGYTTKGDLLGAVGGDLTATLVASTGGNTAGTLGAQWGTIALRRPAWKATDTFRFDRIASAFTAGAGFVLVSANILQNAGA